MSDKISRRGFIKSSLFAGAALGLGFSDITKLRANNRFDTIIRNGLIYNGELRAPVKGDIAIKNGRISALGDLGTSADKVIDAGGNVISPGFIDIHTHTDANMMEAPLGDSKIYQGVTLDIGGNCGDSPFPSSRWENKEAFFADYARQSRGINYGTLIGQGTVRGRFVGDNDTPATADQIKAMVSYVESQMEMGAAGISCGLEYVPGSYAPEAEIAELCKAVARHNGLFAIHMRNEDDRVEIALAEAIRIAKASGVRLQVSHLKAQNAANWHKAPMLLKMIEDAKSSGVDIAFDRYPYIAFSTGMSTFIPLAERQGTTDEILKRLESPAISNKIGEYARSRFERLGGPQNIVITSCRQEANKRYIGMNVADASELAGLEAWEFVRRLLVEERISVDIIGFAMREENVSMFLSHPLGMPASDGSVYSPYGKLGESMPHPRSYGTMPRFFGKYVREQKLMNMETAVHKVTALPASRLALKERGLLVPGYHADIVVFNPDTIMDKATFANPHQFPDGIEYVFVNGVLTLANGKGTGALGGVLL
ncbi:N-acyl-D-glutamate deacylase [bioreactor metagenome]|jgi:N-acyl-D-amino-acid deacylase|uniref:N-acyl-D-glutamate deacylase n=1 Tax=bioreactor metagenome TaxID=1076179 RepID=A0A644VYV1_9ZZZZ|nr:D-aminoacylase [Bacteroidales bacterium]MBP6453666.1 D-aminoacylase [Bacteroidales bacterium]MBP8677903.1 D-aminoacylase [Bacteroidales bacterium]MBP9978587.1 D-aminoacylase [Bacteroidales bacterium]WRQ32717.1 D-aminoacylase [Bacteroidales bacterium MB20-C3-3]